MGSIFAAAQIVAKATQPVDQRSARRNPRRSNRRSR
jgi:hypothetical protein